MVNGLKFRTLFSFRFQLKCWFFTVGVHKMTVKIANMEDTDQTASSEAV